MKDWGFVLGLQPAPQPNIILHTSTLAATIFFNNWACTWQPISIPITSRTYAWSAWYGSSSCSPRI